MKLWCKKTQNDKRCKYWKKNHKQFGFEEGLYSINSNLWDYQNQIKISLEIGERFNPTKLFRFQKKKYVEKRNTK